jgi:hypothetical protein
MSVTVSSDSMLIHRVISDYRKGGTRPTSVKNKSGLFPRFRDEHDLRGRVFGSLGFRSLIRQERRNDFWVFCRGVFSGSCGQKAY